MNVYSNQKNSFMNTYSGKDVDYFVKCLQNNCKKRIERNEEKLRQEKQFKKDAEIQANNHIQEDIYKGKIKGIYIFNRPTDTTNLPASYYDLVFNEFYDNELPLDIYHQIEKKGIVNAHKL